MCVWDEGCEGGGCTGGGTKGCGGAGGGGEGGVGGGDGSSLHEDWPLHVAHVLHTPLEQLVLDDCEEHEPEHEPAMEVHA